MVIIRPGLQIKYTLSVWTYNFWRINHGKGNERKTVERSNEREEV